MTLVQRLVLILICGLFPIYFHKSDISLVVQDFGGFVLAYFTSRPPLKPLLQSHCVSFIDNAQKMDFTVSTYDTE